MHDCIQSTNPINLIMVSEINNDFIDVAIVFEIKTQKTFDNRFEKINNNFYYKNAKTTRHVYYVYGDDTYLRTGRRGTVSRVERNLSHPQRPAELNWSCCVYLYLHTTQPVAVIYVYVSVCTTLVCTYKSLRLKRLLNQPAIV